MSRADAIVYLMRLLHIRYKHARKIVILAEREQRYEVLWSHP